MTPPGKRNKINSILQLAVSGLGLLFLLAVAGLRGIFSLFNGESFPLAISGILDLLLPAALLVPAILYSLLRLTGREAGTCAVNPPGWSGLLLLAWPPLILWCAALLETGDLAMPLFSLVRFTAMLTLAAWVYGVAGFRLPALNARRGWGLLAAGMLGGTLLSGLLEMLLVSALALLGVLALLLSPSLADRLLAIFQAAAGAPDPTAALQALQPLLDSPVLIGAAFLLISVAIPLIEEAVKPAAMWLLLRKGLTPAEGFLGGVVCGAGFGLVENLMSTAPLLEGDWLPVAVMRAGTTLLHMLASGLVGLGLARWRAGGGFLQAAGDYLAAVALHGTWNGFALLLGLEMLNGVDLTPAAYGLLGGMALLSLACLAVLLRLNRHLRRQAAAQAPPQNML